MTALLALTFILTAFSACGKKSVTDGVESTEEELRVVGTIGDYEVCFDELRYVALSCKDIMAVKYGEDIWATEESASKYEDELKAMVMERITANYAVFDLCEQYGYNDVLSNKDVIKDVDNTIDLLLYEYATYSGIDVTVTEGIGGNIKYKYESGGLKKVYKYFREDLADAYLTERVMRITLGAEYAFEVLVNILTVGENKVIFLEEDVNEFMHSDDFICTRHILIQNDPGESIEDNRKKAEEALQLYKDGTPMYKLIGSLYNDDVTTPYEGSYFTKGEMEEAYENAAFALEVGEVSGIVEGEDGFYIIERCEKSEDYMEANFETFADQITYAMVNNIVREHQEKLSLTLNDFGNSIVFHSIPTTRVEKEEK